MPAQPVNNLTPENTQMHNSVPVSIVIVGQSGRLQYEALLFAASLRAHQHSLPYRLFVAEPAPGPEWDDDPRMEAHIRAALAELGAHLLPFQARHFGQAYPQGNKISALMALPKDKPFIFFDTDTLILDDLGRVPFDFDRPSASLRREGTWPKPNLYGPSYSQIWQSLYDRFNLDFASSVDPAQPSGFWQRYLYFNAGFFYFRCPHQFGQRFLDYARSIRDDPPDELACQALFPWLDQIALPLVIHSFGGGRDSLPNGLIDGSVTCHWRNLPLAYARESDEVITLLEQITGRGQLKKLLREYEPFRRFLYQGRGAKARALFDRTDLPRREQGIRHILKREGLWER